MTIIVKIFVIIGFLLSALIITGLFLDITGFDRTKGGYTAPYEGFTGEPVDWDRMDITSTGLVKRGYIVDVLVDGTTGMISFEVFKQTFDWQTFSDRALVVHKPREALIKKGFKPEF